MALCGSTPARSQGLLDAGQFVAVVETLRQGLKIGCVEEIAWRNEWLTGTEFSDLADPLFKSGYGATASACSI